VAKGCALAMPAVDIVAPAIAEFIGNNTSRHSRRNLQHMVNTLIEIDPMGKNKPARAANLADRMITD
jgi:hypothetical protein